MAQREDTSNIRRWHHNGECGLRRAWIRLKIVIIDPSPIPLCFDRFRIVPLREFSHYDKSSACLRLANLNKRKPQPCATLFAPAPPRCMSDPRPIGVFDSGIGGLAVVKALRDLLPHENICYLGDTARVPYGPKSPETVQRYAIELAEMLMRKDAKALVVACNTV